MKYILNESDKYILSERYKLKENYALAERYFLLEDETNTAPASVDRPNKAENITGTAKEHERLLKWFQNFVNKAKEKQTFVNELANLSAFKPTAGASVAEQLTALLKIATDLNQKVKAELNNDNYSKNNKDNIIDLHLKIDFPAGDTIADTKLLIYEYYITIKHLIENYANGITFYQEEITKATDALTKAQVAKKNTQQARTALTQAEATYKYYIGQMPDDADVKLVPKYNNRLDQLQTAIENEQRKLTDLTTKLNTVIVQFNKSLKVYQAFDQNEDQSDNWKKLQLLVDFFYSNEQNCNGIFKLAQLFLTGKNKLPLGMPKPKKPDDTGPSNTEPGNTEPGNTEPGNTEPGNTEPGTKPDDTFAVSEDGTDWYTLLLKYTDAGALTTFWKKYYAETWEKAFGEDIANKVKHIPGFQNEIVSLEEKGFREAFNPFITFIKNNKSNLDIILNNPSAYKEVVNAYHDRIITKKMLQRAIIGKIDTFKNILCIKSFYALSARDAHRAIILQNLVISKCTSDADIANNLEAVFKLSADALNIGQAELTADRMFNFTEEDRIKASPKKQDAWKYATKNTTEYVDALNKVLAKYKATPSTTTSTVEDLLTALLAELKIKP